MKLDDRETASVLAGLRMLQRYPLTPPITEIATNCGTLDALYSNEIDDLCERINCGEFSAAEIARQRDPAEIAKSRRG
jgi:hypothetical protein